VSFNLLDGNLLLSWDYLSTNLKDILRMLKSFIGINNNRNDLVKKIEERINRIEIQLEKGQNLIQNIYNVNGKSYRLKQNDLFFSEMESIVERLKDLIWDADGIKNLLMCYRTNMKLVIYRTLQVYDNQLRAKEINVERKLTEELCIVFGDEYNLLRICQNIIENVYLHSGANYLEIILTIEPSKEYVNIEFIDNGIGIPDQFEFKEGLKIVNEIAILYNGNFTINSVKKDYGNELSKLKFSTTAKLSLPFIRQTTNEVNING
jgi:signal transduction histidine kinase